MTITITSAANPIYCKPGNSAIDCVVTLSNGTVCPYMAVPNDSTDYGQKLWTDLLAGVHGPVAAYPAPGQERMLEALASRRYDVQNGGTTIGGHTFDTDAESRSALIAAYMVANLNPAYECNWKTASGEFVTLEAADIIAVGNAVLAFIQRCFDTEKVVTAGVAGFASEAEIIAAFDAALAA